MTNYMDSLEPSVVEQIDSDYVDWYHDPVKQAQQRVVVVLCLVLMVSTSFALLAVPRNMEKRFN